MISRLVLKLRQWQHQFPEALESLSGRSRLRLYKMLVALFLVIIATYYLSYRFFDQPIEVKVGNIADFDIRVPHDIVYVQPEETQRKKLKARSQVLSVYDRDQSIIHSGTKNLKKLFRYVDSVNREYSDRLKQKLDAAVLDLKQKLGEVISLKDSSLETLLLYNRMNLLSTKAIELYVNIMDEPIVMNKEEMRGDDNNITIRTINIEESVAEEVKSVEDVKDVEQVKKNIYDIAEKRFPTLTTPKLEALVAVVKKMVKPNIFYNESETFRRMEDVVQKTEPVKGVLKKGQVIVRYGEPITQDKYEKILILNKYRSRVNLTKIGGLFLLILSLGGLLVGYFQRYTKLKFSNAKDLTIFALLIFVMMTIVFIVSRIDGIFQPNNIFALYVPIAFLTITLAILFEEKVAIGGGLFLSVFILLAGNNENIASFYVSLATTLLGSYSTSKVKKRTDFLRIGLYVALANMALVIILSLYQGMPVADIGRLLIIAFLNGIGSAIMAFGLIPVIESLFDVTTNFKLLELTDLSSPLLKMLLFKAPGTYQHSIAVASLVETACEDIGANSLLAKVGIYYHDIGKSRSPEYFIENQAPGTKNPHNSISAQESGKVIINHVLYGIELINSNGLPNVLKSFVTGHHGRTVIKYFYHKALEEAKDPSKVNKEDFTYPGPNPRTRETGVAMLADSIEAASRVMDPPITVPKIEELVRKIVNGKVSDGLLDDCELTLQDLQKVSNSFVNTLVGIYHNRIDYPKEDETKSLEKKAQSKTNKSNNNKGKTGQSNANAVSSNRRNS